MVLIGKQEILQNIRADRSLSALITLLFEHEGSINAPIRLSQTDDAIVASLFSIHKRSNVEFKKAGEMLSRRRICNDTDWVHDDLLIFSIIVGNLCFGGFDELISEILRARSVGNDDDKSQKVTESLRSLVNSQSDGPILAIPLVGLNLAFPNRDLDGYLLSKAYSQSVTLEVDVGTNLFLRILGEKISQIAINVGGLENASEYSRLKHFFNSFERRAIVFSQSMFAIIFLVTVCTWFYVAYLYFFSDSITAELSGKLFQMGVVISPFALLFFRRKFLKFARSLFYLFFGGRRMLEQDIRSNQS